MVSWTFQRSNIFERAKMVQHGAWARARELQGRRCHGELLQRKQYKDAGAQHSVGGSKICYAVGKESECPTTPRGSGQSSPFSSGKVQGPIHPMGCQQWDASFFILWGQVGAQCLCKYLPTGSAIRSLHSIVHERLQYNRDLQWHGRHTRCVCAEAAWH